jgi:hypothetical protein
VTIALIIALLDSNSHTAYSLLQSTVLGTLLELAENLSTEELRYRMSVPSGKTDSYTKEVRSMQKQLLEHQRRRNKAAAQGGK